MHTRTVHAERSNDAFSIVHMHIITNSTVEISMDIPVCQWGFTVNPALKTKQSGRCDVTLCHLSDPHCWRQRARGGGYAGGRATNVV